MYCAIVWFILAQPDGAAMTDRQSWMAWASAIGIVIAAVSSFITGILILYWTKGSKARIAERRAAAGLVEAEYKLKELAKKATEENFAKIEAHYVEMLGQAQTLSMHRYTEIKKEAADRYAELKLHAERMQEHVDIMDKKLDACEEKHLKCVEEASFMAGKIEAIEKMQSATCMEIEHLKSKSS